MLTDEKVKQFFTFDNFKKLYEYFASHSENLCECCKNYIECLEKDCSCYEVLGNKSIDESGKEFFWNRDLTCLDLNYGDCARFDGTICYDCINLDTGYDGFEWNGEIKD